MPFNYDDASQVSANGWRQGSVLPSDLVAILINEHQIPAVNSCQSKARSGWLGKYLTAWRHAVERVRLAKNLQPETDRWMVVSQDCDLVNADWSKEPYVELIRIREAGTGDVAGEWLTSPRTLLFRDPLTDKSSPKLTCSIHDRVLIDRKYLVSHRPSSDLSLAPENARRICHLIAQRYVRAAFPDAFNNRVKKSLDSQRTRKSGALYKNSDLLTGIYMRVSEEELPDEQPYKVFIWGAMLVIDFENESSRRKAQLSLNELEAVLGTCDGIEIVECLLKSEQDITIDHLHQWKRWDFDLLSLKPKRKNDPIPEVSDITIPYQTR